MNSFSISLLLVLIVSLLYFSFKMIRTKQLEDLLINKQKEKKVILEKKTYRFEYAYIFVLVLMFSFSLSSQSNFVNYDPLMDSPQEPTSNSLKDLINQEMPDLLNNELEGVYLVHVNNLSDTIEFKLDETNVEYLDIETYNIDYNMVTTQEDYVVLSENANNTLLVNTVLNSTALETYGYMSSENLVLEESNTYLIIGAIISEDESANINDDRINSLEFLYPWNVFLLEGYNKELTIEEQTDAVKERILELLEEYYD